MKQISITLLLSLAICNHLFAQKNKVHFDTVSRKSQFEFRFPDTLNNSFLAQLRTEYSLSKLIENKTQDIEKVLAVLNWTHSQWEHNGSNEPSKNDALTILKEAKDGKKFRCVEYGIVSKTALDALNYKARVIAVKTKDVETTRFGAGHVLAEVWLPQFSKWVLIDGQFNVMPILDNIPLNAVELQQAIAENKNYQLIDINGEVSKKRRRKYQSFIFDYLYFIDTKFDNRNLAVNEKLTYEGKSGLMLVPVGAKNPTVFQIKYPLDYVVYTSSVKEFYQSPK